MKIRKGGCAATNFILPQINESASLRVYQQ
jgi:hypothetical protein